MSKKQIYTQFAINIANDNSHGYSMANRTGNPDFDCSSLVSKSLQVAGFSIGLDNTWGLAEDLPRLGFENVFNKVNVKTGGGLQYGDILLEANAHTAIYCGDGKVVHARSSEGNSIPGDQSGNEIRVQPYWNFPWTSVWRFPENDSTNTSGTNNNVVVVKPTAPTPIATTPTINKTANFSIELRELSKGDTGDDVASMQKILIGSRCSVGIDGADGDFGNNTEIGLRLYQAKNGLTSNGKCDKATWIKLLGVN